MAPAVGQAGGGSLKTRNHRAGTCTGDPGPGGPGRRGAMSQAGARPRNRPNRQRIIARGIVFGGDVSMWKQRAVSLCSCIALLPLIVACTGGPGSPPQAYAPPAPSSPPSFAAIQTGLTPRYAAPAAEAAALPYQAAGVPAGPGGVYTVAARTLPSRRRAGERYRAIDRRSRSFGRRPGLVDRAELGDPGGDGGAASGRIGAGFGGGGHLGRDRRRHLQRRDDLFLRRQRPTQSLGPEIR